MSKRYHDEPAGRKTAVVKRLLGPLLVFSIVINLLTLVLPIYMLQIYDRVLTSRNLTTLLLLTLVAFGFLAAGSLLTHYRSRMAARLGTQISQKLEQPAFGLLLKQQLAVKPVQGKLIQNLDLIREFVGGGGMIRLFDIPWTPLFILIIFLLHPLTGAVASAFALALLIVDWLSDRKTIGRSQVYGEARARADQFLESSLQKAEAVWSMGMADSVGTDWHRRRAKALAEHSKAGDANSGTDSVRRFIQQGAQMAMLGTGAYLAVLDLITPGTIVAGSIIGARALAPIGGISRSIRQYREVRRALAEFNALTPTDDVGSKHHIMMALRPQLQAQNLAVNLGETMQPVIQGLDFELEAGQTMAIVGPSGTGKSMLIKTLIGVRSPAAGTVKINGVDLHQLSGDRLGRMIGYVPQKFALLDGSFGQNIARFGAATVEGLDDVINRTGLRDCLPLLPNGYETPMSVAAKYLSPIHFRFVSLARALYGDPMLLVLDQFDDGLDQAWLDILGRALGQSHSQEQIVVMVTNRASIVQQLDRVMILTKRGVERFCDVHQLPSMAQIK